jgi:uncharacterized protein
MKTTSIDVSEKSIEAFCRKWKVRELSLFGSALREDFGPDSDVDVLVSFAPGDGMTLESFMQMREELSGMFGGRPVDLVEKRLVRNPYRRHAILTSRRVLYAAP